ncbi:flagellar protein export ATPase FliI [Heliorestis acidaminivorans]|uniref:Type 3 secretion system ATPase n=1 Tax=Heliorestis acidaminivorans TaxID=553427 RepID=A0A6I0F0C3_9FIRM|nr:flagellar protein export ATPase FliI [Heliorestis acidaminivorans]KAB2954396.1 flagellar protein export ATPase FliI [Heliorestis acidaminivorans]
MQKYIDALKKTDPVRLNGKVNQVIGLVVQSDGPSARLGELCYLSTQSSGERIGAEVVGFRDKKTLLMPLGDMTGIGPGAQVLASGDVLKVSVGEHLLGRVLDGLGNFMDSYNPMGFYEAYPLDATPPHPLKRQRIQEILPFGVKAIDSMLTCGKGQRLGIFAGSGVGKSTLLGMIARNTSADINVIALIGERGREVREFLEKDLGPEGLARSVVVVATSDQPALVRLKGALVATAIAEYFRDQGRDVMLMMDSVTRFAMAQREIGLAIGEPPATRGYTPSVFAMLPKLLERSGTSDHGTITGLYTVLVDGDDMNEPIADAVRGILDGHIVLSREMAAQNHYPAIDVLRSVSRVMIELVTPEHRELSARLRQVLATYNDAKDLLDIGAYQSGANARIDYAIKKINACNNFLKQEIEEAVPIEHTLAQLRELFSS